MSKISLKPNASGTGVFSLEAPNSNVDRTLNLPDEDGTVLSSVSTNIPAGGLVGQFDPLNMPTGSIIQAVHHVDPDTSLIETSSSNFVDSGIEATITPKSTNSTILITSSFNADTEQTDSRSVFTIFRNSTTNIAAGQPLDALERIHPVDNERILMNVVMIGEDTPNTTDPVTYSIFFREQNGEFPIKIRNNIILARITLMEIAG